MKLPSNLDVATHMQASGKYFTRELLAKEMNVTAREATKFLHSIRNAQRYIVKVNKDPTLSVKVVSIKTLKKKNLDSLWPTALGLKANKRSCGNNHLANV